MNIVTAKEKKLIRLPQKRELLWCAALFFASRAPVFGVFPFGLSFLAAALDKELWYLGIAGYVLGIVSAGGDLVRYAFSVLFLILGFAFFEKKMSKAVLCGAASLLGGGCALVFYGQSAILGITVLGEAALCTISCLIFSEIRTFSEDQPMQEQTLISGVLFCGILLGGCSGLILPGEIKISSVFCLLLLMLSGGWCSLPLAGCIGMTLGFFCSLNRSDAILFSAVCGMGAMLSYFLSELAKPGVIAGYFLSLFISWLYSGTLTLSVGEASLAAAIYLAVPRRICQRLGMNLAKCFQHPESGRTGRILVQELKTAAHSFSELGHTLAGLAGKDGKPGTAEELLDTVCERICPSCPQWTSCWQEHYGDTVQRIYQILETVEQQGYCDPDNLPRAFRENCMRSEAFLSEFGHVYELFKERAIRRNHAVSGQRYAARQYEEISGYMEQLSERMRNGFSFLRTAEDKLSRSLARSGLHAGEVSVLEKAHHDPEVYIKPAEKMDAELLEKITSDIFGAPMRIQQEEPDFTLMAEDHIRLLVSHRQTAENPDCACGDYAAEFSLPGGKSCLLLCDGMGSGADAYGESRMAAELLTEFMSAGFSAQTAVSLVNSTLILHSGRESFSTIDLLCIDRRTGLADFFKVGAAGSYLLHKGRAEKLEAGTLPVGILDDISCGCNQRTLSAGDTVVMISDGVTGAEEDDWLSEFLIAHQENPNLADLILTEAKKRENPKTADDMSVIVVKIHSFRDEDK